MQPSSLGPYELLGELGRGTSGVVYKARHLIGRILALKMPALGTGEEAPRRLAWFQREYLALAQMAHRDEPGIPTLYDVGQNKAGQCYLAREFVEGSTFEHLAESEALDLRDGLDILSTIAATVQRVHDHGFAHCNLQPPNILVGMDGNAKLIGFGRVSLLAGSAKLPAGVSGESPEVDVRALQEMAAWLCETLRQPIPARLEAVVRHGSIANAAALGEGLRGCAAI